MRAVAAVGYCLGLTLWIAALSTAAVAAMNVFPTLIPTPVQLEGYDALPAEAHGRLLAGMVMQPIFITTELMQFVAVPLTVAALLWQISRSRRPRGVWAFRLRSLLVFLASANFAMYAGFVAPRMHRHLRGYWDALAQHQPDDAVARLTDFNSLHPVADFMLMINLFLLVMAVVVSALETSACPLVQPAPTNST